MKGQLIQSSEEEINALVYPVTCCNGKMTIKQSSVYANTEGRTTLACPTCGTEWIVTIFFRQMGKKMPEPMPLKNCLVKDCPEVARRNGLCQSHFGLLQSVGDQALRKESAA